MLRWLPIALGTFTVAGGALAQPPTPRTPRGHPDLQGFWANNNATPLERPEAFGNKGTLTDEELAELKERAIGPLPR
jgi:hypothetical protein